MATLKGQNLRLAKNVGTNASGHRFFAGALSCSLDINVQVEDSTTCDSTGDWQNNEVTGKSWTASTEAAMFDGVLEAGSFITYEKSGSKYYEVKADGTRITHNFKAGEYILVYGANTAIEYGGTTKTNTGGIISQAFTSDSVVSIYTTSAPAKPIFWMKLDHLEEQMFMTRAFADIFDGNAIRLAMDVTNGDKNRQVVGTVFEGYCFVTSFSVNSTNRQRPTFAIGFTGTGAPFDQNAPAVASLSLDDEDGEQIPEF